MVQVLFVQIRTPQRKGLRFKVLSDSVEVLTGQARDCIRFWQFVTWSAA